MEAFAINLMLTKNKTYSSERLFKGSETLGVGKFQGSETLKGMKLSREWNFKGSESLRGVKL